MKIINNILLVALLSVSLPFMANAQDTPQDTPLVPLTGVIKGTSTVSIGASSKLVDTNTGGMWSCSDNAVATVDIHGNITGIATGAANVSYTYANEEFALTIDIITITVNAAPVSGTSLGNNSGNGSSIILNDLTPGIWSSNSATEDKTTTFPGAFPVSDDYAVVAR